MSFLKIGGKTDMNVAQPVRVKANGDIINSHEWEAENLTIYNATHTDTTVARVGFDGSISLASYGLISLRIRNKTGAPAHFVMYSDSTDTGSTPLVDFDNSPIVFDVPASDNDMVITPQDIPALAYLRILKFSVACTATPTVENGIIRVWVVKKR